MCHVMNAEEVNETGPDTVNENTLASDCLMSGTRFGWRQLLVDSGAPISALSPPSS